MRVIRRAACFTLMGFAILPVVVAAASRPPSDVPVRIGGQADLDACGSWAAVSGLKPDGDGFLAVRGGPGAGHAMRDRLHEGDAFFVCGASADGKWLPIVYPHKGQDAAECGVSSPVARETVYRGPCAWGWVRSDWVQILAG